MWSQFLVLLFQVSVAWWDAGHILVGEIARRGISPDQLVRLNALLALQQGFYPSRSVLPYACLWMDDVKPSTTAFDPWHYINWPYCNDTLSPDNCTDTYRVPSVTLLSQLVIMSNTLGIHSTSRNADPWTKAFSLRVLLHQVGDIHQPFHNVGLFTDAFPNGDRGGNDFRVYYNASGTMLDNAHSLFDSVAGQFTDRAPNPITETYAQFIVAQANAIMEEFPLSNYSQILPNSTEKSDTFYNQWSQEGFQLAVNKGYDLMRFNETLQDDYITMLRPLLRERIAIGGYRMAYLLSNANLTIAGSVPECPSSSETTPAPPTATIVVGVLGLVLIVVAFVVGMRVQRGKSHRPIFPLAEE